ncbi:MAG TPA: hypothetical protein VLH10_05525 [Yinghuangia sp.]|uniref:hypothetical protein n=1 Tax=Yinghuangia sp. YIM S10712 TaxID=3436930 RepID=UPI002C567424|nr:hypothetical protein [Yinghuangia sp.]
MTDADSPGDRRAGVPQADSGTQIFVDPGGRRRRRLRRAATLAGVGLIGFLALVATGAVSSSPLGTPPWVPQPKEDGTPAGGTDDNPTGASGSPSATKKAPTRVPGKSPTAIPVAVTTVTTASAASGTPVAEPPAPSAGVPSSNAPQTDATAKPGNAPTPPGQTRRPTAANSNPGRP